MAKKIVIPHYIAKKRSIYEFDTDLLDEKGEPVPKIDSKGNKMYSSTGKIMPQKVIIRFQERVTSRAYGIYSDFVPFEYDADGKTVWCRQMADLNEPTRKNVMKRLEELVKDANSCVITKDMYEKSKNPQAYDYKKQVEAKDERIEALEAELAKYKQSQTKAQPQQQGGNK